MASPRAPASTSVPLVEGSEHSRLFQAIPLGKEERKGLRLAALHQVSLAPHPALASQLDTTKATVLPLVMKPVPAFCVPTPFYLFCLVPWCLPAQRYSPSSRLHLLLCPRVLLQTGILTRKAAPGARPPLSDAACPLCPLPARDCPSVSPSMSSCPWPLRSAWSKDCKMAAIGSFK